MSGREGRSRRRKKDNKKDSRERVGRKFSVPRSPRYDPRIRPLVRILTEGGKEWSPPSPWRFRPGRHCSNPSRGGEGGRGRGRESSEDREARRALAGKCEGPREALESQTHVKMPTIPKMAPCSKICDVRTMMTPPRGRRESPAEDRYEHLFGGEDPSLRGGAPPQRGPTGPEEDPYADLMALMEDQQLVGGRFAPNKGSQKVGSSGNEDGRGPLRDEVDLQKKPQKNERKKEVFPSPCVSKVRLEENPRSRTLGMTGKENLHPVGKSVLDPAREGRMPLSRDQKQNQEQKAKEVQPCTDRDSKQARRNRTRNMRRKERKQGKGTSKGDTQTPDNNKGGPSEIGRSDPGSREDMQPKPPKSVPPFGGKGHWSGSTAPRGGREGDGWRAQQAGNRTCPGDLGHNGQGKEVQEERSRVEQTTLQAAPKFGSAPPPGPVGPKDNGSGRGRSAKYQPGVKALTMSALGRDYSAFTKHLCRELREVLLSLPAESRTVRRVNNFLYAKYAVKVAQFVSLMKTDTIFAAVACGAGLSLNETSEEKSKEARGYRADYDVMATRKDDQEDGGGHTHSEDGRSPKTTATAAAAQGSVQGTEIPWRNPEKAANERRAEEAVLTKGNVTPSRSIPKTANKFQSDEVLQAPAVGGAEGGTASGAGEEIQKKGEGPPGVLPTGAGQVLKEGCPPLLESKTTGIVNTHEMLKMGGEEEQELDLQEVEGGCDQQLPVNPNRARVSVERSPDNKGNKSTGNNKRKRDRDESERR